MVPLLSKQLKNVRRWLQYVQMSYWSEVVQETTTFTLPNPDEYERPEEIREIEVNRVKARSMAVEADALNFGDKLRASLLGQLNEAMSDWEDRDLRRSFVHMQVCVRGELLICCLLRACYLSCVRHC